MSESLLPYDSAPSSQPAAFAARPGSTAWECISLAEFPSQTVWVWFKPPNLPHGLVIKFAANQPSDPQYSPLTMRRLLDAFGIQAASVASWYMGGVPYDGQRGTSPLFDQPVPLASDLEIFVYIDPAYVEVAYAANLRTDDGEIEQTAHTPDRLLEVIATDWEATIKIERQMVPLRKQLAALMGRLNALNRDLSPEEVAHGDRMDQNEWRDARRWLRDSAARLSRCIKEHDVGETSLAGKRAWFEQIYRQHIVPRQQFDGIEQAHREFAAYRKRFQTVFNTMLAAHAAASQDGERRAQQVLNRLAVKVRAARTKRPPTAKGRN